MDRKKIEAYRKQLSQEYQNLVTSMDRSRLAAEEIKEENTQDEADLAAMSHDKHLLYNLRESDIQRAAFIQRALKAIDRGQYGECSSCGEDINEKRIQAVPWATMCVQCQEKTEQENTPSRESVGPRDETETEP